MIFASTVILALAISSVPAALGAPIGNRNFDVRAMRRSMESATVEARTPEHHSARSYVSGGGNDPVARAASPDTSNVQKRKDNPDSTWRRERASDSIPRHVRDTISRKRASGKPPVEARQSDSSPQTTPEARSEEGKVDAPKSPAGQTREEQPRSENPSDDSTVKRQEPRSEPEGLNVEARREPVESGELNRRGPIRAIAMFKRTLESLD